MTATWSSSRDQTLHSCERKYYYQYLAPARINSYDPVLREIAFLKKLKTIPLWKGSLFHEVVAEYFDKVRQRLNFQIDSLLQNLEMKIELQWLHSLRKEYRKAPRNIGQGDAVALMEHEYGVGVAETIVSDIAGDIRDWFMRLSKWASDNDILWKLQQAARCWIEPQAYGPSAPGFDFDDVQVLAKVDMALSSNDGGFDIYDWKSSEAPSRPVWDIEQSELQVRVYQLWPHLRFDVPLSAIKAHLVYLGNSPPIHKIFEMDGNKKEYILNLVGKSIARARQFDTNHSEDVSLRDFDFAASTGTCRFCVFKRLCQRELTV